MVSELFRTKPTERILAESEEHQGGLKKTLTALDLTALGVGAIIGTGIFVLTGVAAATKAGPAVSLSFVFTGVACIFAALCYAEFASMLPIAGSAYTYAYATIGELVAWIIGWDLILEYALGASAVSVGWSGYFYNFITALGVPFPPWLATTAPEFAGFLSKHHLDPASTMPHLLGVPVAFNLPAAAIILVLTALLVVGIRESARFNALIVGLKFLVVLFVIFMGLPYVRTSHWEPFLPFGWNGIINGAAIVFFAYIGFDAVSTAAEETCNPQRDLPIGIIASLVICTVLYVAVSLVITGMVPYHQIDLVAPLAVAFSDVGFHWAAKVIEVGAVAGLTSVLLVLMMSQPRIFYAMSRDGLLPPWFSHVHNRFRTPANGTVLTGLVVATVAALTPIKDLAEMVNIGTLFAFCLVCAAVIILRRRAPEMQRAFRTPWVPVVPVLGIVFNLYMMIHLPGITWLRLVVWLLIGLVVYFNYGRHHSRLATEP